MRRQALRIARKADILTLAEKRIFSLYRISLGLVGASPTCFHAIPSARRCGLHALRLKIYWDR